MGHLFWQPTPVLVLSILQFHLKLLVRYGQIPITIMKFFLLQLCQHLSCSGWILDGLASSPLTATLPPPCTSLSCLTLENSCYFCIELKKFYLTTCISARRCGSGRFLEGGEKGWIGGKYKFQVEISFSPGLAGTWEGTALGLGPVGKWPTCNLCRKIGCFDLYIAIYVSYTGCPKKNALSECCWSHCALAQ